MRLSVLLLALLLAVPARAEPQSDRVAALRRGVNLTNWFRYPARADAASIRTYIGDAALADLRRAGFTFVRLAVQPEFLFGDAERPALLAEAVGRLQRQGLAVLVELHPTTWHLEVSADDRAKFAAAWRALGTLLAPFDPRLTFPELLNEPVFTDDSAGWEALQAQTLALVRSAMPRSTVILAGNDWSSIDGLRRLHPVADGNVIYTFHFYEPAALVTLASYQPDVDAAAMARLPFPAGPPCPPDGMSGPTLAVARFYCGEHWDAAKLRVRLDLAGEWARRNHVAVLAGEFGVSGQLNAASRLAWLGAVRQALEAGRVGWAVWGYDDAMGLGVHRPPGERPKLDPAVLHALGRDVPSSN